MKEAIWLKVKRYLFYKRKWLELLLVQNLDIPVEVC